MFPKKDLDMFVAVRKPIQINLGVTSDWDLNRDVRERYLVIATTRKANFYPLVEDEKPALSRGGSVSMPPLLRMAFNAHKETTRSGSRKENWSVIAIDLVIKKKKP